MNLLDKDDHVGDNEVNFIDPGGNMTPIEFIKAIQVQLPELVHYDRPRQDKARFYTASVPGRGVLYIEIPFPLRAVLEDVDVDEVIKTAVESIEDTLKHYGWIKIRDSEDGNHWVPGEIIELAKQKWSEISDKTSVFYARALIVEMPILKPTAKIIKDDLTWNMLGADAMLNPEEYTLEEHLKIAEETSPFMLKRVTLEPIADNWSAGYSPEKDYLCVAEIEKMVSGDYRVKIPS